MANDQEPKVGEAATLSLLVACPHSFLECSPVNNSADFIISESLAFADMKIHPGRQPETVLKCSQEVLVTRIHSASHASTEPVCAVART